MALPPTAFEVAVGTIPYARHFGLRDDEAVCGVPGLSTMRLQFSYHPAPPSGGPHKRLALSQTGSLCKLPNTTRFSYLQAHCMPWLEARAL